MKNIFYYFRHRKKKKEREMFPYFEVKSCIPMSFGILFRCRTLQDVTLSEGQLLRLQNADRQVSVHCLTVEKEGVVSVKPTLCRRDEAVRITVECTEDLMYFPVNGTIIYA